MSAAERERAARQPSAAPTASPTRTRSSSTIDSMPDGSDKTRVGTVVPMGWVVFWLLILIAVVGVFVVFSIFGRRRREQELADAREEALRWYERLGGQVMNLSATDDPAVKQALVDAGERYNAAGSQLERSTSAKQYELARETALEGLAYV